MSQYKEFRLIIAGTRTFTDYLLLKNTCDYVLADIVGKYQKITIISGTAKGADSLGERYAKEKNYNLERFPADWETNGKRAGYIRNYDMALYCKKADKYGCLVFWDKLSKGSKHMIEIAKKEAIPCIVRDYVNHEFYLN